MVTGAYQDFFVAVAAASGALVGLLFVALSVAPDRSGAAQTVLYQVRASSALTALVAPLLLSLIALIPGTNMGTPAIVAGVLGLMFVAGTTHRVLSLQQTARERLRFVSVLAGFTLVMLIEVGAGVAQNVRIGNIDGLDWMSGAMVASLGVGIGRAWELGGSRHSGLSTSVRDLLHGEPKPNKLGPLSE